jgi:hypothetical protein
MSEPETKALEQKLDNLLERLKATKDPELRRPLLAEMGVLMAELDSVVFKEN